MTRSALFICSPIGLGHARRRDSASHPRQRHERERRRHDRSDAKTRGGQRPQRRRDSACRRQRDHHRTSPAFLPRRGRRDVGDHLPRIHARLPRGVLAPVATGFTTPARIGDFVETQPRQQAVVFQAFPGPGLLAATVASMQSSM